MLSIRESWAKAELWVGRDRLCSATKWYNTQMAVMRKLATSKWEMEKVMSEQP